MYTHKKKGEIKARETGTEFIFTPVGIFFDDNAFDDSGGVEDGGDDSEDLLKHRWITTKLIMKMIRMTKT